MENEQLVMSLMEVTNLPIEEAKRFLAAADNNVEVAIQNYYDSQLGDAQEPQQEPADPAPNEDDYDEVRAPLPREFSQLVEEESVRNAQLNRVKRQFASSFRDLKKETEIQEDLARGIAPKRKCLEDIYRNPIDITANLDFYSAKHFGEKHGKWIALLINDESFLSLSFNRDIFNTDSREKVKTLIKKNFILLRKNSNCEESIKILQNYKLSEQSIPIFLIIDSLTGELKKNFGDTKNLTLKSVVNELKKYTTTATKDLLYNPAIEESDDEDYYPVPSFAASSSRIAALSTIVNLSHLKKSSAANQSDSEESFASIDSDDVPESDGEDSKQLKVVQKTGCKTETITREIPILKE